MKSRLIVIALLMLCGLGAAQAQDTEPQYRLRQVDAKQFTETVPEVVQLWQDELPAYYGKVPHTPMSDVINYEIADKQLHDALFQQNFDVLSKLYDAISGIAEYSPYTTNIDYDWMMPLFKAWLREHPNADFSNPKTLDIPGFNVQSQTANFDGGSRDEYAVHLDFGSLSEFAVLRKNPTAKEGYDIFDLLTDDSISPPYTSELTGNELIDVNADGLSEWIFHDDLRDYYDWCKNFTLMGWQNGHFQNLIADAPQDKCRSGDIEFVNLDQDAAKEIRQISYNGDNWGCTVTTTVIWDWDGSRYRLIQEKTDQEADLGCEISAAEPLVWDGKIESAVPLYEKGLQLGWKALARSLNADEQAEMTQYARARLAIAYVLIGRTEDAKRLITQLKSEAPQSEMMAVLIKQLSATSPTALSICTAAYNVFWDYSRSTFTYNLPSKIQVGRIHFVCCIQDNFPPAPEKAGCDAPRLIDQTLTNKKFTTQQSLIEQVIASGIEVESSFHADFNGDGRDEWLIWPIAKVAPILFVPDKDSYVISRPDVRRPNAYSQLEARPLPTGKGTNLVDWIYLEPNAPNTDLYRYDVSVRGYPCESNASFYGTMRLWHLEGFDLINKLEFPLCEKRNINALFQKGNQEINGWSSQTVAEIDNYYKAVTYIWDSTLQTYFDPLPTPTSTNNGTINQPNLLSEADLFNEMGTIMEEIGQTHAEDALERINHALENHVPNVLPLLTNGLHYYRALALEMLKHPDEALAEYVAIEKSAPQSAWGKLAALHLECVANCEKS